MGIRYVRNPQTGLFHVNLIDTPRQQAVFNPRFFARIANVSDRAVLGFTELNTLQLATLGFAVSEAKETEVVAV
jgi:hypothetical protein